MLRLSLRLRLEPGVDSQLLHAAAVAAAVATIAAAVATSSSSAAHAAAAHAAAALAATAFAPPADGLHGQPRSQLQGVLCRG